MRWPSSRYRMAALSVLLSLTLGVYAYIYFPEPISSFDRSFDFNIKQSQPLIGSIVEAEPTLRSLFLRRTSVAYTQGGWPAATQVFDELTNSEINAYAGDRETLDCSAAWHSVLISLRPTPKLCRDFLNGRLGDPAMRAAMVPAQAACKAMTIDGGHRRRTQSRPDVLDDAAFGATYALTLAALTPVEKAALAAPSSDDATYCQAGIRRSEAALRLTPDVAARYARTKFHESGLIAAGEPSSPELPTLHCAAPGTLFTLSMQGQDGLPIIWESLGQSGWDCRIRSSASGERGLWGDDRTNPLRLMGDLAVGKTTRTTEIANDGTERSVTWRVTGFESFWLALGRVSAYTLEKDVIEGENRHYVVTHYWSPELGFDIGQHSVAKQGSLPDWIAPNWQLINMKAPGIETERGAILAKSDAAAEISFAMERAEAIHPNLFWSADRSSIRARKDAVIAALPDPANAMDVYLALSEITGLLGDGHISLSHPAGRRGDVLTTYRKSGGKLLLMTATPTQAGLQVQSSAADGLAQGDIVTKINGQDAKVLFVRASALKSGEVQFQQHAAEDELPGLLWDLGVLPPFKVTGVFGGVTGQLELSGQPLVPRYEAPTETEDQGIRMRSLPDGVIALEFDRMTAERTAFHDRLLTLFAEIRSVEPQGLIIDLRRNGGGNPSLGEDLLSFLTDKPHRLFASHELRASPECRAYFTNLYGRNSGPARDIAGLSDGETQHKDVPVTTPSQNPLRYSGPVAVLIGPGTFSAADMLASSISDFGLATLIGQDTAEIPTNFGQACPVQLPLTGIVMRVPSAYVVRGSGDTSNLDDVHPDIYVARSGNDLGPDVDLVAARLWIRGKTTARLAR